MLILKNVRVFAAMLVIGGLVPAHALAEDTQPGGTDAGTEIGEPTWDDVERLIDERKLASASEAASLVLETARTSNDAEGWTRALIELVRLNKELQGPEEAVRLLRSSPWPDDTIQHAILELYYAHLLADYVRKAPWRIRSREPILTAGELEIEKWDLDRIVEESNRAFADLWSRRDEWGDAPDGVLARYLEPNDYPPGIRSTLRDTVAYLWVEQLSRDSLWSPAQDDEARRLDVDRLIAGDPEGSIELDLASSDIHPMLKIGAILDDLERWHAAHDRQEAALEARLERLLLIETNFDSDRQFASLLDHLETTLADFDQDLPWWSMGQAHLAEWLQFSEHLDSKVRAHASAVAGHDRHPESVGGRRCAAIAATIEAPHFDLEIMQADGPGRRSIEVSSRNLSELHFRAYPYDLIEQVTRLKGRDSRLHLGLNVASQVIGETGPVAEWTLTLPNPPDFLSHRTFSTPPLTQPGAYLIVASARRDFADEQNSKKALNFLLTDLVLLSGSVPGGYEVTAVSGSTGDPQQGVTVDLWLKDWVDNNEVVDSKLTDVDGRVVFSGFKNDREQHLIVAHREDDLAYDFHDPRQGWDREPQVDEFAFIYTDRHVYRPGQTVFWKVVAFQGDDSIPSFQSLPNTPITVTLFDQGGDVVSKLMVTTNDFGSASGSFRIPEGRLLGVYEIESSIEGWAGVWVEEYKRPTFEVTFDEATNEIRLNRPVTLTGEARYFFGLAVTGAQVRWEVTRQPFYPSWWSWWYEEDWRASRDVASGVTETDADGRFEIGFVAEADEFEAENGVKYGFELAVEVTDEGGETRESELRFRLGFVAVDASIEVGRGFLTNDGPASIEVTRTGLNGLPLAGEGSWRLIELDQPRQTPMPVDVPKPIPPHLQPHATEGDGLRPRWAHTYDPGEVVARWPEGAERATGILNHGEDGLGFIQLPTLDPGAYRLTYTTQDRYGATLDVSEQILVADDQSAKLAVPALLQLEKSTAEAGETARLLIHSGFSDQPMTLEMQQRGDLLERLEIEAGEGGIFEFPVTLDHRPGLSFLLSFMRDFQYVELYADLVVPWTDRELDLHFSTFRDKVRPGMTETITVTVAGRAGWSLDPGTVEVLAYMYDRSLDLFGWHYNPDFLEQYDDFVYASGYHVSLGGSRPSWLFRKGFAVIPKGPVLPDELMIWHSGYPEPPAEKTPVDPEIDAMIEEAMERSFQGEVTVTGSLIPTEASFTALSPVTVADDRPDLGSIDKTLPIDPRSDFSETAFWEPHVELDENGSATVEFQVPDSVTGWNVWAHALTTDLRHGSVHRTTRSVKELMVRPYLPRFFREGDHAVVKVLVNNAGEENLTGTLDFEILDPETDQDLRSEFGLDHAASTGVPFSVEPGAGADLSFTLDVPSRVGPVAFKATARAGAFTDGELRAVPVLPGRMHLIQSRFAALRDRDRRELHFPDMAANDDPSLIHDQLVVTIDGQLFNSVLNALPYLADYPYECNEQTLNRFLSTAIVTSVFDDHPALAALTTNAAKRETRLEAWESPDPNRKLALEETPWLAAARGEDTTKLDHIRVLDPFVAATQRDAALARLELAQTREGGFPWWAGGRPSTHMTLYMLHGFARAVDHGVDVPRETIELGWSFVHGFYIAELERLRNGKELELEQLVYLGFVLSSYPDLAWTGGLFTEENQRFLLDLGFDRWRELPSLSNGHLAMALERAGRHDDAVMVFDSVMDSAITDPDLGTYWAPSDRAWLWHNDTVETHAFALRVLSELDPDDERRHGLVQWLMLDKAFGHWKSTRATAEVVSALVHYLEREGALGNREEVTVKIGRQKSRFVFEPNEINAAPARVVVPGPEIDPETMASVLVKKQSKGLAFASATWSFSTEELPKEAQGELLGVRREYFRRSKDGDRWILEPVAEGASLSPGDQVEVWLTIHASHPAEYVHLRDPRGAGFEPEALHSQHRWGDSLSWYEEVRDSGTNFFFDRLPAGEHTLTYRLSASMSGTFKIGPATLQSMYAPEFTAYSAGHRIEIAGE